VPLVPYPYADEPLTSGFTQSCAHVTMLRYLRQKTVWWRKFAMRAAFPALFCFLLCAAPSSAQSPDGAVSSETPAAVEKGTPSPMILSGKGPIASGKTKTIEFGVGYSYVSHAESSPSQRLGLQGVDASATIGFSRFGLKADVGYARAGNVLGTGTHSDILSYLVGPVFRPVSTRKYEIYAHALVGGARESGPFLTSGGIILVGGWATSYAWEAGGGVKYWISDTLAISTEADCLRAAYYDPSARLRGELNLKTTAGVVFYFGRRSGNRRRDGR
jgi:hypothetical protein